jgi:chloride channel 3/4/5
MSHAYLQNLRHIIFTEGGELKGMMTKTDIATLTTSHMPFAGALTGQSQAH